MGDGWARRILIESVPPSMVGKLPLLVRIVGEHACPREDVGGPHAYAELLTILADHGHEQPRDMARWIGGEFDPAGSDLNRINRDWKRTKRRSR